MLMNILIICSLGLIGLALTLFADRLDAEEYMPEAPKKSRTFKTGKLTFKGDN